MRSAWPGTRIQRCTFHAFSAVKRQTTTRPRTQAGVELYGLARDLLSITSPAEARDWMEDLGAWNQRWKTFLAEKTRGADGRITHTHYRLIRAKNSLNTLARKQTIFTYLDPALACEGDPIPSMSNLIEGKINSQLRALLRDHRGMSLDHQVKAVLWWCERHTQDPQTPAQLLEHTITDADIAALFARAHYRHQAQQEITRWGTGVNWNDFHRSVPWNETY